MRVDVCGGKYTVVFGSDNRLHALRYGEEWRNCVGDNLIYYLAVELEEARLKVAELEKQLASHTIDCNAIGSL